MGGLVRTAPSQSLLQRMLECCINTRRHWGVLSHAIAVFRAQMHIPRLRDPPVALNKQASAPSTPPEAHRAPLSPPIRPPYLTTTTLLLSARYHTRSAR